ncbi:hypothetical protein PI95_015660 [Hassallia byssoidea VB512170]|uniref:Uncharacterized protein n=1 Tax=Hassallia byssoidea VB512170 TaxID=1304833 RepID=A0A846HB85_9CYAN|nr:hypothetical protein [Hassalia byssoidea]NEU73954.1 hypothetical protein [Hassalia byssoidea VB512170]
MPSASSNRYQSRLFNFVHRQSRRLGDRLNSTFRHLQVATKWSLQALLYSVVILVQQAVESVGKQLHPQTPQNRLHLEANNIRSQLETPPAADTPIQRVLQALEDPFETARQPDKGNVNTSFLGFWGFKFFPNQPSASSLTSDSTVTDIPKRHLTTVQGIASQLENRNLVLVTADNQILDILTRQQQEKLQDRIIGEIADYWHYWQLATEKETEVLPEIERLLTKLTGNGIITPALPEETETQALVKSEEVLAFLDASVAKLESNALTPLSRATLTVQQRSREIIKVAQTQLNIFLYGKELTVRGEEIQSDRLRIKAIIEAAVNYFFGRTGKKLDASPPASKVSPALPISRQSQNQDLVADPWLSWDDLFGDFEPIESEVTQTANPALPANQSPEYVVQNWLNSYQNIPKKPASKLVKQQKPTTDLTRTEKASGKVAAIKSSESKISQVESNKMETSQKQRLQTTEIEAKPDWIETKATSIGYEKHPLEQILAWLDAALLWLEEKFVKLFQSLQQFWVGKSNHR